eukprot:TRINITY_DN8931_c0_g3_i1.p1 TRINITY_DN8931_c0_g3~~TRINITY_DN8931_c0_g3_i1.p1  ORF type:complete len:593 (-),score=68.88 TRINITY_DN8931_c0_g3_i1:189-1745(-)
MLGGFIPGVLFLYTNYLSAGSRSVISLLVAVTFVTLLGTFSSLGSVSLSIVLSLVLGFGNYGNVIGPEDIPFRERFQVSSAFYAVVAGFSFFLKYKKDQCTCCLLGLLISTANHTGAYLVTRTLTSTLLYVAVCVFQGYCLLLWQRRLRRLPPGLKQCKFVRLDYLRKIARNGEGIRRCQELPPQAFGDPKKALHLIVLSHRWMDGYRCDVSTPDYPLGLRLQTVLSKLEMHFSVESFGVGHGFKERFRRICTALVGGSDVVVFMDFMCLPQRGLDDDGRVRERSADEQILFDACLPHMSVFYSMFPVMVCPEVAAGCAEYSISGWCFSEVSVAALGKQLDLFSSSFVQEARPAEMPSVLQGDALQALKANFENELGTKIFVYESDRSIVRDLYDGFLLKAQLRDAIDKKDAPSFQRVLGEIQAKHLEILLDQPIDLRLNTLLHLAVTRKFHEAVLGLLECGADVSLKNISGDSPWQWKMLPRFCNSAARTCLTFNAAAASASASVPSPIIVGSTLSL